MRTSGSTDTSMNSSIATSATNMVKNVATMSKTKMGAIGIFVVLTILLIVTIIAYLVWRLNRSVLKQTVIIKNPKKLSTPTNFADGRIASTSVGQSFSFSFWLYLTDFESSENGKLVMWRSKTPTDVSAANPIVFIDPKVNQMYICIKTNRNPSPLPTKLMDLVQSKDKSRWGYLVATVQYVPLQRWVNYTFAIDSTMLTVYQDGSMYTVSSIYDMVDVNNTVTPRPVFGSSSGSVDVGSLGTGSISGSIRGFIARLNFYNYAVTSRQALSIYESGPSNSTNLLGNIGIAEYAIRTPIYRIEDEDSNDL
jgi:hypothetical protein